MATTCPLDEWLEAMEAALPAAFLEWSTPKEGEHLVAPGGSRTGKTLHAFPVPHEGTHWAWVAEDGAKAVPMAKSLRDFGGNAYRDRHVSSPLFRAACLARVEDRRSIGQRRWDELHPQQKADMLASREVS